MQAQVSKTGSTAERTLRIWKRRFLCMALQKQDSNANSHHSIHCPAKPGSATWSVMPAKFCSSLMVGELVQGSFKSILHKAMRQENFLHAPLNTFNNPHSLIRCSSSTIVCVHQYIAVFLTITIKKHSEYTEQWHSLLCVPKRKALYCRALSNMQFA